MNLKAQAIRISRFGENGSFRDVRHLLLCAVVFPGGKMFSVV